MRAPDCPTKDCPRSVTYARTGSGRYVFDAACSEHAGTRPLEDALVAELERTAALREEPTDPLPRRHDTHVSMPARGDIDEALASVNAEERDRRAFIEQAFAEEKGKALREPVGVITDGPMSGQLIYREVPEPRGPFLGTERPAPTPGSRAWMADVMERVFEECRQLRGAGQKEYAHRDENAFANFERVAERMGFSRGQALMVYTEKHLDGIHSFLQGHRSQRESVKGRINDVIVYMCLLRGMVEQDEDEERRIGAVRVSGGA
ncbi:MAG TPA: hypothetical protein VEA38_23035 [Terriglobales bacterium]|nr:hypothetical protein [Terriglobales bacterium]